MGVIKGQNFRVTIGGKIVAAASSCSLHLATSLEESSTKDSTNDWQQQECVGKSWDGSADALVIVDSSETGLVAFDATELIGTTVTIVFEQTEGDKNRSAVSGGVKYTGSAIISDLSLQAGNRANCTYSIQFQGTGSLVKS